MNISITGIITLLSFVISILFCFVAWIMTIKKNNKSVWATSCSFSFMAITLLMEYRAVLDWVNREDWAALLDVVPSIFPMMSGYIIVMIMANLFPLIGAMKSKWS
ncbi:MAG: hypothetical protein Q4E53_14290 [Eubacteriales bacterium]|nr:hypothetical protein [Eubacteriales bacterium]